MHDALLIGLAALLVEAVAGYPRALYVRIGHPVTWMGALLVRLDRTLNREVDGQRHRRFAGFAALAALLLVSGGAGWALTEAAYATLPRWAAILALGVLASSCLAQRSLDTHVRAVADALERDGLDAGRRAVSMIVGRDTAALDEAGVARAAIESLAENFSDGIVAPAFWLVLGGLPCGLAYKAANTADSMIGHRTPRHEAFGFAAAKFDDVVNWPAARLAASWIVLAAATVPGASAREAWRIVRRDAAGHASPNAGWPEAAMAGALGVRLGGPRRYGGSLVEDAVMGDGDAVSGAATIRGALRVYRAACAMNVGVVALAALLIAR